MSARGCRQTMGLASLYIDGLLSSASSQALESHLQSCADCRREVHALQDATQFAASVQPLREILAEHPDHPEANMLLGVALVQTGQPSLAVWSLEKAAASAEYGVESGLLLASAFVAIQAYEDAVRAVDRVLERDPAQTQAMRELLFHPNGAINTATVGKSAQVLAGMAGIQVPASARVLVAKLDKVGPEEPLSREKLTTVLGWYEKRVGNWAATARWR